MDTRDEAKNEVEPRIDTLRRRALRATEEYERALKEDAMLKSPAGAFGLEAGQALGLSEPDLDHVFRYHMPGPEQLPKYTAIRNAGKFFAQVILDNVPHGADREDAIRKIREAVMTANAAVALGGRL